MTLEEAIKICEDNAAEIGGNPQSDYHASCYKQVAEWLAQLKEAKRLLYLVLSDINTDSCCSNCFSCKRLGSCDFSERYEWRHTDEVEKLLNN